jgi:hypothetical protein
MHSSSFPITFRTALHWASHRGQEDVVRLLLSNGADVTIKTNKGQTALDLCTNDKYPTIQSILEAQHVERTTAGPEPAMSIVPAYMKEPDLEKSWLLPDEFSENKVERVIRQETAKDMLAKGEQTGPEDVPSATAKQQQVAPTNSNDSTGKAKFQRFEAHSPNPTFCFDRKRSTRLPRDQIG